ncbi:DUF3955 domain-containing protein [Staphylococcus caeli]|uniref:DUF3955 domain-containing protein n=1 Tax=Staphylococcus caeli TaxID=2201815 RepID=UPI003F56BE2C
MNKKLLFASITSFILSIILGICFVMNSGYVDENGILREPWYLVQVAITFVVIGCFFMLFAIGRWLIGKLED